MLLEQKESLPKVSIVIATYNRQACILAAIDSALNQTYENVEVVVVDDGSTDNTASLVAGKNNDSRLNYYRLDANRGSSFARNFGIQKATGDFFIVWDSDDILYKNAVTDLLEFYNKNKTAFTISAPTYVYRNGEKIDIEPIATGQLSFERIVCAKMPKFKLVRMSRKNISSDTLYYSKNLDFMFNSYLAKDGPWFHINKPLGRHNLVSDKNSLTLLRKKRTKKLSMDRTTHIEKYLMIFGEYIKEHRKELYAHHAYAAAIGFLFLKDYNKAKLYSRESCSNLLNFRHTFVYLAARNIFFELMFKSFYK